MTVADEDSSGVTFSVKLPLPEPTVAVPVKFRVKAAEDVMLFGLPASVTPLASAPPL